MDKEADEFVSVLVPKRRVLEVYALLGKERGSVPPIAGGGDDDGSGAPGAPLVWKRPDRAVVVRAYRESSPKMKLLFEFLADNPGRHVPGEELGAGIGYTRAQLAGVFGAFGRRWKNRYKNPGNWPIRADNPAESGGNLEYWLEPEEVALVNEIRERK